jgi:hypothetical protein
MGKRGSEIQQGIMQHPLDLTMDFHDRLERATPSRNQPKISGVLRAFLPIPAQFAYRPSSGGRRILLTAMDSRLASYLQREKQNTPLP